MGADPVAVLQRTHTIAVVGASPDPSRPSWGVLRYLQSVGYRVLPVRADGVPVLGIPSARSLAELDEPIDLVDVFRRAEHCAAHAEEAVAVGAQALWLQLGIRSFEARAIAEAAALDYVEDACTAVVHARSVRRSG